MTFKQHGKWAVLAISVILSACTPKGDINIEGRIDNASFDGHEVYLIDFETHTPLDTVKIDKGTFQFVRQSDSLATPLCIIATDEVDENRYQTMCVLEKGNISVDLDNDEIGGTPLNDAYCKAHKEFIAWQNSMIQLRMAYSNAADAAAQADIEREAEEQYKAGTSILNDLYQTNRDNVLGAYAMYQLLYTCETSAEMDSVLVDASPFITNFAPVQQLLANQKAMDSKAAQTACGSHYADIDLIDCATGRSTRLANFVDGRVTLLDFWASWCGPCRREIPKIADIYRKYAGKGLNVVGINVWDKIGRAHV